MTSRNSELISFFEERLEDIKAYLSLLRDVEDVARFGPPRLSRSSLTITVTQQKILYSSLYLQLYNLVEASVSRCIDAVTEAATSSLGSWRAEDFNEALRKEWVRATARTHIILSPEHRLQSAIEMCEHLIARLPVRELTIDSGGGGNWDDEAIQRLSVRLGCELNISKEVLSAVKRPERDDLGAMKLVKKLRNNLAHGDISFAECGEGVLVSELERLTDAVGNYLREAISCYVTYIELFDFLRPEKRPAGAA